MSVTRQWARETERFAPSLRVHVHHGGERLERRPSSPTRRGRAISSSRRTTSRRATSTRCRRCSGTDFVLDEAQDVKNPATKRARSLRRIDARRRLAMTGTPIENRLDELWAIMDIVNPGLLGSRERFQRTFARPIEAYGDDARARAPARDGAAVHPPPPEGQPGGRAGAAEDHVTKEYCRLTLEQASLYRATVDRWMPRIEEHERSFGRRGAVLAMLSQLKQVCNHPEMVLPTGRPLAGRSGKLERLVELLRGDAGRRQGARVHAVPGLRPDRAAPARAASAARSGSSTAASAAASATSSWRRSPTRDGPSVLVVSIRAGGRGLNLPAANHVFHFDRWWNPAVEQQATDRAYRFGQHKDVFVHEPHLHRDARGADRRAARLEAGAGGEGRRGSRGRLAGRARPRHDPRRGDAVGRGDGGGVRVLNDGRPVFAGDSDDPIGRGPWARCSQRRSSATRARRAPSGGASWPGPVTSTRWSIDVGEITGIAIGSGGLGVPGLARADPIPPRIWSAVIGSASGRTRFQAAAEGREQSVQLEHVMTVDWEEPLVPPSRAIRSHVHVPGRRLQRDLQARHGARIRRRSRRRRGSRPSSSNGAGASPRRGRGREQAAARPEHVGDPWAAGPLPELGPPRPLPVGSVLKRLGASGLVVDGADLRDALEPAYAAFAAKV